MQKLTTAQAYALQVKADRRAAARERASGAVAADDNRVNAMFANAEVAAKPKVAKPAAGKVRKYAPWKTAEYQAIVDTYLRLAAGGDVVKDEVIAAHRSAYPRRSEGAVSFVVAHLRGLDAQHEGELTLTVAEGLLAAAYEADPERFPAGGEVVEARLEGLLGSLR
jgi:hypothetical protein